MKNKIVYKDQTEFELAVYDYINMSASGFYVLIANIDGFSKIILRHGYKVGEIILDKTEKRLRRGLRSCDAIVHLGGDEFAVLIKTPHRDVFMGYLNKMKKVFKYPIIVGSYEIGVTLSFGYSCYPHDGKKLKQLMQNAVKNLQKNKLRKRTARIRRTGSWPTISRQELQGAIRNNQFVIHYQPQVSVDSGKVSGFEALLRWQHPHKGLVPPDQFIPSLEKTGQIIPAGEWVIRTVCSDINRWFKTGNDFKVSINLSILQLLDGDFIPFIRKVLREYGVGPASLEFELTESIAMKYKEVLPVISELREMGFRLALDDFGTGYSSLSQLEHTPIDTLKIDRSFIHTVGNAEKPSPILDLIINIGHQLGLQLVAEGVETTEQLDYLAIRNCHKVQGYLLAKPMPAPELEERYFNNGTRKKVKTC